YTDAGGRIELTAAVEGAMLRVRVRDNGIGLTPTGLQSAFVMFSQSEDARSRSEGGLGIGLALVKGLVALHGGTVSAASEGPGCGSEFTVVLPLGAADARFVADAPASLDGVRVSPRRKRILVADDNEDAADSLAMLLRLAGHEVRIATSGRAALALAEAFRPDVALLDIGMPEMSGYEVAGALRAARWSGGLTLIALTGWGQDEDKRQAQAAGFDHHLTKPVGFDRLEALLSGADG
ncbi:MAG: response regulator, partial [Steroidobacteraceae bacterium]